MRAVALSGDGSFLATSYFVGTIGLFFTLFLIFSRVFPVIALAELKSILKKTGNQYKKKSVL